MAAGKGPTAVQSCVAACCCLQIKERDTVGDWMLSSNADGQPSLFQRLVCQCGPRERKNANLESVHPNLRGLAGVTIQNGTHPTAGSLQTLKWVRWNPKKRQADLPVFGGFFGDTGVWTEPVACYWCFQMNLSRCANYKYRFTFDEDYKHATIDIVTNPLTGCCPCAPLCCIPCCPAWLVIPRCCVAFDMNLTEGADDGSSWDRRSKVCCRPWELTYVLQEVITFDGQRGKYYENLAQKAPEQVMITF